MKAREHWDALTSAGKIAVAVVVLAVVVLAVSGVRSIVSSGETSISHMSCAELVTKLERIQHDLRPGAPFRVQQQAGRDSTTLNRRVDALGGCPGEPSLQ